MGIQIVRRIPELALATLELHFTTVETTDLVNPHFPPMVKTKCVLPNSDHAPAIKQNNTNSDSIEHCLRGELISLLYVPKGKDPHRLGGYAHGEKVSQLKCVVSYNLVLQRPDHCYGRVERVTEEEVSMVHLVSRAPPIAKFQLLNKCSLRVHSGLDIKPSSATR